MGKIRRRPLFFRRDERTIETRPHYARSVKRKKWKLVPEKERERERVRAKQSSRRRCRFPEWSTPQKKKWILLSWNNKSEICFITLTRICGDGLGLDLAFNFGIRRFWKIETTTTTAARQTRKLNSFDRGHCSHLHCIGNKIDAKVNLFACGGSAYWKVENCCFKCVTLRLYVLLRRLTVFQVIIWNVTSACLMST